MRTLLLALCLLLLSSFSARADKIDEFTEGLINKRHIAGLSLAIIQDGRMVDSEQLSPNLSGQTTKAALAVTVRLWLP